MGIEINPSPHQTESTLLIIPVDETERKTSAVVDPENGQQVKNGTASNDDNGFDHYLDVEDKLEESWPVTFERSISLLAGPTMDSTFIENVTRSPKITPNLFRRKVCSPNCIVYDY